MPIRQSLWAITSQLAIVGGGLVSSILLNRILQPEGRGEVALVTLWPTVIVYVLIAGWVPAICVRVSRYPQESRSVWSAWLACGALSSLGVMALTWFLIPYLLHGHAELWSQTRWFLLFILFTAAGTPSVAALEGLGRFDLSARVRVGNCVLMVPLLGLMGYGHVLTPFTYVIALTVVTALINGYAVWLFARHSGGGWRPAFAGTERYAMQAAPLGWSQMIQQRLDLILISLLAAGDSAGIGSYTAGTALGGLLTPVAIGLATVLLPECAKRKSEAAVDYFAKTGRMFVLTCGVGMIPLLFAGEWILYLAYGKEYVDGAHAFRVALVKGFVMGLLGMAMSAVQGINRPSIATLCGAISCLVGATAGGLLLRPIGYVGASYGQIIGCLVGIMVLYPTLGRYGFQVTSLVPMREDLFSLWSLFKRFLSKRVGRERPKTLVPTAMELRVEEPLLVPREKADAV